MALTQAETYTIGELAKCAGVTPRTVRYYCAEGLLPPPDVTGRYAAYSEKHLCRLRLIARLKSAYLPLSEIKSRISSLTTEEILAQLDSEPATSPDPLQQKSHPEPHAIRPDASPEEDIAANLAHFLEETLSLSSERSAAAPSRRRRVLLISPMLSPATGRFSDLEQSGDMSGGYMADETLAESWKRIRLAPGVELHFRLPESPEAREALQRVIAQTQDVFKLLR